MAAAVAEVTAAAVSLGGGTDMCGGGNIKFPDPNEVGQAQWSWNNLNQYTPYGSVEYGAPTFDAEGNPISPGSMTQTLDPGLLELQEAMMGLRGSVLGQLGGMFGAGDFGFGSPGGGGSGGYGGGGVRGGSGGSGDGDGGGRMDNKMGLLGGANPFRLPGLATRNGGAGRVTPDDPNNPYNYNFGGSNMYGYGEDLNPLFASAHAPSIRSGFDTHNLPELLGANDLTGERERITQAKFDRMKGLLDPVFQEKNTALQERMANRGMPVGAEEYNILSDQLGQQENEAYTNAALDADLAGLQEMQGLTGMSAQQRAQLFGEKANLLGMNNQARQQAFGENMGVRDALLRSLLGQGQLGIQQGQFGLQEQGQEFGQLASLLGITGAPGAGGDLSQFYGPSPIDMMNAYGMNQQGQMFNAGNQITGAGLMSGLFGLGGSALGSMGPWW